MSPMDETMEKILGPTGRLLVGVVFICLLISLNAVASAQLPSLPDLQKELKESQSDPLNYNPREWLVRLSHPPNTSGLLYGFSSSKEKIAMNKTPTGERWDDNYIDKIVDNALNTSMINEGKNDQMARKSTQLQPIGNNLNIDVAGISVSAVNTVQGGSAVATSNIIIKPVQIIICPSEVAEKLR